MIRFYGEELLAPHLTPKLEDHPLSAICDCLFNIFAATLHTGGFSSIQNLRTHHAVVTGTHLSQDTSICWFIYLFVCLCYDIVSFSDHVMSNVRMTDEWLIAEFVGNSHGTVQVPTWHLLGINEKNYRKWVWVFSVLVLTQTCVVPGKGPLVPTGYENVWDL